MICAAVSADHGRTAWADGPPLAGAAGPPHTPDMSWISGTVVYFLIWWVVLFAVLPIGAQPDPAGDPESGWRGTPRRPRFWRTVGITTLASTLIWIGVAALIQSDWLSFRTGWLAMPEK